MAYKQTLDFNSLIPSALQNPTLSTLISNLFNRFVSQEDSVFIAGNTGTGVPINPLAKIVEPDLEHQENSLIPGLFFKAGTEQHLFTFQDLINRLSVLDVNTTDLRAWMAEQSFNYAPPINYDKLVNYSEYYWVGSAHGAGTGPSWNPNTLPEFYVIERPKSTDTIKMPVDLATTQNINLWINDRPSETFTLTFISNSTFIISSDLSTLATTLGVLTDLTPGAVNIFSIDAPSSSTAPSLSSPVPTAYPLIKFTITNGQTGFAAGDHFTIHVTYYTSSTSAGLTSPSTVGKGAITGITSLSPFMYVDGVQLRGGERLLVWNQTNPAENGIYITTVGSKWALAADVNEAVDYPSNSIVYVNGGATHSGNTFTSTGTLGSTLEFTVSSTLAPSPVNNWQIYNYWVHRDDIAALAPLGYSLNNSTQANRPIIEYLNTVQLNTAIDSMGAPTQASPSNYSQVKTAFNQIPQFDLFRYDGTHSGSTSGIFFYSESPFAPIDQVLRRRVELTANGDYVFGLGINDSQSRLLFYKDAGVLKNIWRPGVSIPTATTPEFTGAVGKGTISITAISQTADNQTWTIKALTSTTFSVSGDRSGNVGTATVGIPFTCDDLTVLVTSGLNPFVVGELFTFKIHAPLSPRYIENLNGNIVNFPGGITADIANPAGPTGAWLTPLRMFQNLPRQTLNEISYADFTDHARSVLFNQNGFTGASFGDNNSRDIAFNPGLGGKIREFGSNFPLLASMLMENTLSPLTILNFAQQQYNIALSSIDSFVLAQLPNYIANGSIIQTSTITPSAPDIQGLEAMFERERQVNQNLSSVFSDSTAKVSNWPATLPMIGLLPKVQPSIGFDNELGIQVIICHDGHIIPLAQENTDFDRALVQVMVTRSDGTQSPGIFAPSAPLTPYAGQLWMDTTNFKLSVFSVTYDTATAPSSGGAGQTWFNRNTSVLYQWNTTSVSWVLSATPISSYWIPFITSNVINSLILAVEQKLFDSVHPAQQQNLNLQLAANSKYAEYELTQFAAEYNYDTFAPDYDPTNAFTWNYSQATIPGLSHVPARWFNVYLEYFAQFSGVIPTDRPNLYPWMLLGFAVKPSNWTALYPSTPGRLWSDAMWAAIQAAHPGMKLCVDTTSDALLPPYVSPASITPSPAQALLTVIPPGITDSYLFGDDGPVEEVWKKSLEYNYGLARSYFRLYPLQFLDTSWGETHMSTGDNLRLERNLMTSLPSSKFLLHGEPLNIVNSFTSAQTQDRVIVSPGGSITWTGAAVVNFTVTHCANNTTVFYAYVNNKLIGMVYEGVQFSFPTTDGITFTNVTIEDLGIPFEMGEQIQITFYTNTITVTSEIPAVVVSPVLGCLGCVGTGTPTEIITSIQTSPPPTFAHIPAKAKVFKGVGQWFTNLLRYNTIDSTISLPILAYRGWTVNLAHRFGGLIRPDSLTIDSTQGLIPDTGYEIMIKRSMNTKSLWISALRVQLVQMGASVLAPEGYFIPPSDGSDWQFRVEVFNPEYERATYYVLDTSGPYEDFFALAKQSTPIAWKRYMNKLSTETIPMPILITGIQNVLNFIYGYTDYLEDQGWVANTTDNPVTDAQTGRTINWQLEIEKYINQVYSDMSAGQAYILNPFMSKLYLQTPVGLLSNFNKTTFIDAFSTQAIYDVTGSPIPQSNLNILRTDVQASIESSTPMFSAHVFIDEFEHAIVFNNTFTTDPTSSVLFDLFLGQAIDTAYMTYTRQADLNFKPTFNGFFISGNNVARNIVSSIDNMQNYYDSNQSFSDPTTAQNAMTLLGFKTNAYFDKINVSPTTQLNFWQSMISSKGTTDSILAFMNYSAFLDGSIDEYWAYKLASYGDARTNITPELKIQPQDVSQAFTCLQFYSSTNTNYSALPLYIQIEENDASRWFSIDDLGVNLNFNGKQISETVIVPSSDTFPAYIRLQNIYHNDTADALGPTISGPSGSVVINAQLIKVEQAGTYTVSGYTWINPTKLSPVKLFDYSQSTLDLQIGLWHPAIGIHAFEPLQTINTTQATDPAHYNYSVQTTNNPTYSNVRPWGEHEVGWVWWDTSNLAYIPYYDAMIYPNRQTRHTRWGSLAGYASIDLYQWVNSPVHPSLYNALAASQEGDSSLAPTQRASGTVGFVNNYVADRVISIVPIAWSQAGVGNGNAHPAFGPATFVTVYAAASSLIADTGRVADIDLVSGRNFGGWDVLNSQPVGEVIIGTQLGYDIGASTGPGTPIISPQTISFGNISSISVSNIPNSTIFGTIIGVVSLKYLDNGNGTFALRMLSETGIYEDVQLTSWYSNNLAVNSSLTYKFAMFGLEVTIIRTTTGTISAKDIATACSNPNNDIFIRESVTFTEIVPLPSTIFINDTTNPEYNSSDYEWKAWTVPTQADLSADLVPPFNMWLPYVGTPVEVAATSTVVAAMNASANVWTMPNGVVIKRYISSWSPFIELTDTVLTAISTGTDLISFTIPNLINNTIISTQLSLYANGIQVNPANYGTASNVVGFTTPLPEGTSVYALYRAYQPTSSDLSFNPLVKDNFQIQKWYKQDYEFTELETRDVNGNVTGTTYYFWVKGTTVAQPKQDMALAQATQLLRSGESAYMVFDRMISTPSTKYPNGASFDSCAIAGLNTWVKKTDSFKLRFLKDFTLRNDPEQLKLKNVHTEWMLLRENQLTPVPEALWLSLTNAICGQDVSGNPLPSQARNNYDSVNGTNYRYGFGLGQIYADTANVTATVLHTILNTKLTINIGTRVIPNYITALNFNQSSTWFSTPSAARKTMALIWTTATGQQINEIFFNTLNDALNNNYEFTDLFKTSLITVNSTTVVQAQSSQEQLDEFF